MCRWLAYRGEALQPSLLLLDAQHSLVAQSLNSPLGAETVNGDGFGFGWYPADPGRAVIRRCSTASSRPGTTRICVRSVRRCEAPLFFSHVRAAGGPPIQQTNCHPFRYENWLFMHNGFLADFGKVKRDLTFAIEPALYPHVRGTTDSEVLFHLALTFGLKDDPVEAMRETVRLVESVGREHGVRFPMQGTIAVSDGATLWTFRYSTQGRSRSLFHSVDIPAIRQMYPDAERLDLFGDDAHVVVSEPLNDLPGTFVEVPESTVAILDQDGYRHQPFLAAA